MNAWSDGRVSRDPARSWHVLLPARTVSTDKTADSLSAGPSSSGTHADRLWKPPLSAQQLVSRLAAMAGRFRRNARLRAAPNILPILTAISRSLRAMRDSTDPALQAGKRLADVLRAQPAPVPHNDPLAQIVWATVMRSKLTFDAISHMVGNELDYQAAMLARPLFEDMVIAHWVDYNRDDPGWLVQRFFDHRDAMALDQKAMEKQVGWSLGTPLTSTPDKELRSRQNELGKEYRGRAKRDWWDPGSDGRGSGRDIGIEGVVDILEDAALRGERYHPRFAGGSESLLRRMQTALWSWYSRLLHHTAIGLPFQPEPSGKPSLVNDPVVGLRAFFSAYWSYGQQLYLIHENYVDWDFAAYDDLFIEGLIQVGAVGLDDGQLQVGVQRVKPLRIPKERWRSR